MTYLVTRKDLARMYPRASSAWLDAFATLVPVLFPFYKISRLRWVHFCGQIAAETDGLALNPMRENMGYDAAGLLKHFSFRLNKFITDNKKRKPPTLVLGRTFNSAASLASAIQFKKELIADIVYGDREGTPWMQGHLYIGRGPTQCTHLNGYKSLQAEIARQPGGAIYDLVGNPDQLATDPEIGVRAAFANFEKEGLWMWCDRDDCDTLSDALNTGNIHDNVKPFGLPRRRSETARAKAIWPADAWKDAATDIAVVPAAVAAPVAAAAREMRFGDEGDDVEALQTRLAALRFSVGLIDGRFGRQTKLALIAFQADHDLLADGIAGKRTMEVLAQADVPDLGPRTQITKADLKESGSRTIAVTSKGKQAFLAIKGFSLFEFLDQYFDFGFLDSILSKGEHVKSLWTRSKDLARSAIPETVMSAPTAGEHGLIMAACIVSASIAFVGWLALRNVENIRVDDARKGLNLSH